MNDTPWMTTTTQPQPWLLPETAWSGSNAAARLEHLSQDFEPVSLDQMDAVALLNRIDTKFVMTIEQLVNGLSDLRNDYWILEASSQRLNHYRTLYFDTRGFDLYHAHVNERPERYKVRSREYIDSNLSFLEVKHRTRKDRTIKERIRTARPVAQITHETELWLNSVFPLTGTALEPKLWNTFTRITLVSKQMCERVTLDIDLEFSSADRLISLDGLAIAEIKMDLACGASPFLAQMRKQKIRQCGFSKYAMGIALLYDGVKKNALKPKMLLVEKIRCYNIQKDIARPILQC